MNNQTDNSDNHRQGLSRKTFLLLAFMSIVALTATFVVANSGFEFKTRLIAFLSIAGIFLVIAVILYFQKPGIVGVDFARPEKQEDPDRVFNEKVEERLLLLEEANKFFSASLRANDMFRLIASRVREIVEYKTCVLFLIDDENQLNASFATGENSRLITKNKIGCDEGLAGKTFVSGKIETDAKLNLDARVMSKESLDGLRSGVSVPLMRGEETFGVLLLYGGKENAFSQQEIILLEAIGERVAPLLNSSFSFERNISNAMTDSLTNLPNERAFYLVLENQIAEAQRFPEQRALTIMAIDIKGFADFNRNFGFSTGDNLLAFASEIIKDQLRKMDFLSRSMNDEFWVVLPTASDEITDNIKKRIVAAFSKKTFNLPENKKHSVKLNFGSATFLKDGETTNQLLQRAILRKKQDKTDKENTVIMFPKEYVN